MYPRHSNRKGGDMDPTQVVFQEHEDDDEMSLGYTPESPLDLTQCVDGDRGKESGGEVKVVDEE